MWKCANPVRYMMYLASVREAIAVSKRMNRRDIVLDGHCCRGWIEGAHSGRHPRLRGIPALDRLLGVYHLLLQVAGRVE